MISLTSAASKGTGLHRLVSSMPVFGRRLCLLGLTCLPLALTAQSTLYNFITISGVAAKPGSTNGAGGGMNLPLFNNPMTVIQNSAGNFYVADASNNLIRQVTPTGTVTTYAGSPGLIGGTNGKGVDSGVSFNSPQGMALDSAGNLYVADYNGNTIRKVATDGTVTTIAGSTTAGFADGTGTAATFSKPAGLAVDSAGNVYVTDSFNQTIRKITPAGVVTTFAGTAGAIGALDGTGAAERFS